MKINKNYYKKKTISLLIFFLAIWLHGNAEGKDSSSFTFSGYVDAYYAHYSDSMPINTQSKFADVCARNNTFGLNIFQLSCQYNSNKLRAIATLHFGDIPLNAGSSTYNTNTSSSFNYIQEANIGFKVNKYIWIDAGFFKTHIGTESLLPKENICNSVSVITFYEPWFQSGVKISYAPNEQLFFCIHLLNGYNTFVETNKKKNLGITATYALGTKGSIGYFNIIGDETPDSINSAKSHIRFLNNFVFNYQLTKELKMVLGFDYVSQQNSSLTNANEAAVIYSGIATFKYQLQPKMAIYARYEMYNDASGMLSGVIHDIKNTITGYKLNGFTGGIEYKPTDNSYVRLESRYLIMDDYQKIFLTDSKATNIRTEWMINAGITF